MKNELTRREALEKLARLGLAAAGTAVLSALPGGISQAQPAASKIVVAKDGNLYGRLINALKPFGGIERFVRKGSKVLLKPNIGWAREPRQAGNTNPDLVGHLVKLCYKAGAKEVCVYENPCDSYVYTFQKSGIKDAVEREGGKIFAAVTENFYTPESVPRGKSLKQVSIVKYIREADCFINMPIAKDHSATKVTLGMKNMMGLIWDRGYWHGNDLDQCIADFMTIVKPHLTIVDATRILLTHGPKGPGEVKEPKTLIAGTDFVACDSYAVSLFGKKGSDIRHIQLAGKMGLGQADQGKMVIQKV
ncbi:MAG: DUF362 domain-containing protein [Candidatus Eremiobacteraeota bacterium]|nr:DUF362 domain-containing protein [Candidatus Eremiobacteraeota bacterium]